MRDLAARVKTYWAAQADPEEEAAKAPGGATKKRRLLDEDADQKSLYDGLANHVQTALETAIEAQATAADAEMGDGEEQQGDGAKQIPAEASEGLARHFNETVEQVWGAVRRKRRARSAQFEAKDKTPADEVEEEERAFRAQQAAAQQAAAAATPAPGKGSAKGVKGKGKGEPNLDELPEFDENGEPLSG